MKKIIESFLLICLFFSTVASSSSPLPPAPQSIFNHPSTILPGETVVSNVTLPDIVWDPPGRTIVNLGNDNAYTPAISATLNNSVPTDKHVITRDDSIVFAGYYSPSMMDMLYATGQSDWLDSVSFVLNPLNMDFHTFRESGFLFNGTLIDGKYTGYALILAKTGSTAELRLVYANNVSMTAASWTNLIGSTPVGAPFRTNIQDQSTQPFHIKVERDNVTGAFKIFLDNQPVPVADISSPLINGGEFGFYTQYDAHSCTRLTLIQYSQIAITERTEPSTSEATANFVDENGNPIALPQTLEGVVDEAFFVTPPATLVYEGVTYEFVRSESPNNNLTNIPYNQDPAENVVTLYYRIRTSVSGSGGGGGGGSSPTATPTPTPISVNRPQLNKEDHIWYIRGYDDGTLQANGRITRAETALVFYRLLKPEYREITVPNHYMFVDVDPNEWYGLSVNLLAYYGIILGYPDGDFQPHNPITRSEMAVIIERFDDIVETGEVPFRDLDPTHWAYTHIVSAVRKGWFEGDDYGNFRGYDPITRAEFVTVVNRVLNRHILMEDLPMLSIQPFPDFSSSHWAFEAFMEAVHSHDYSRRVDGVHEIWLGITGHGLNEVYNK